MIMKIGEYAEPKTIEHPGKWIGWVIKFRGFKQRDVAKEIKINPTQFSELCNGKRNITPSLAIKLESFLDYNYSAEEWMSFQIKYTLNELRNKSLKPPVLS